MSSPGRTTWAVAVVGLVGQAVTLVVGTVALAHTAATIGDQDPRTSFDALFDTVLGPVIYTVGAVVVGLFALLLLVASSLCLLPGGRFVALVTALVAQLPVVGVPVYVIAGGGAATLPLVAVIVGGAMVVLGALFPATWRWSRRPVGTVADAPAAVGA